LIRAAESFEVQPPHDHDGDTAHDEEDTPPPIALTILADVLTGVGFGLLLTGGFAISGVQVDWKRGAVWGAAGFAAFALAPALGLLPSPPGAAEAELVPRQLWWILTAVCTAAALWLIAFRRAALFIALAGALLVLPHLVGAPKAMTDSNLPEALEWRFAAASLGTTLVFWLVLGTLAGWITARLEPDHS
jgi:cobalt transporter subunit CbtA